MLFVYMTFPTEEEARKVGKRIVGEGLARCVNIISGMESLFIWKGMMRNEKECILIAKTAERNYAKLESRVKQLHSYGMPCVIAFKVSKGSKEFVGWVDGKE